MLGLLRHGINSGEGGMNPEQTLGNLEPQGHEWSN